MPGLRLFLSPWLVALLVVQGLLGAHAYVRRRHPVLLVFSIVAFLCASGLAFLWAAPLLPAKERAVWGLLSPLYLAVAMWLAAKVSPGGETAALQALSMAAAFSMGMALTLDQHRGAALDEEMWPQQSLHASDAPSQKNSSRTVSDMCSDLAHLGRDTAREDTKAAKNAKNANANANDARDANAANAADTASRSTEKHFSAYSWHASNHSQDSTIRHPPNHFADTLHPAPEFHSTAGTSTENLPRKELSAKASERTLVDDLLLWLVQASMAPSTWDDGENWMAPPAVLAKVRAPARARSLDTFPVPRRSIDAGAPSLDAPTPSANTLRSARSVQNLESRTLECWDRAHRPKDANPPIDAAPYPAMPVTPYMPTPVTPHSEDSLRPEALRTDASPRKRSPRRSSDSAPSTILEHAEEALDAAELLIPIAAPRWGGGAVRHVSLHEWENNRAWQSAWPRAPGPLLYPGLSDKYALSEDAFAARAHFAAEASRLASAKSSPDFATLQFSTEFAALGFATKPNMYDSADCESTSDLNVTDAGPENYSQPVVPSSPASHASLKSPSPRLSAAPSLHTYRQDSPPPLTPRESPETPPPSTPPGTPCAASTSPLKKVFGMFRLLLALPQRSHKHSASALLARRHRHSASLASFLVSLASAKSSRSGSPRKALKALLTEPKSFLARDPPPAFMLAPPPEPQLLPAFEDNWDAETAGALDRSRVSSFPTSVVGEYDKEKWRTLKELERRTLSPHPARTDTLA